MMGLDSPSTAGRVMVTARTLPLLGISYITSSIRRSINARNARAPVPFFNACTASSRSASVENSSSTPSIAMSLANCLVRAFFVSVNTDTNWSSVNSSNKRAAASKQDIGRIDADVFLLRVFAAALRRHVANGAFQNFQQRLLHAFPRNVAGDRNVFRLARDLVDLIDINDAHLGPFDI